MVYFVIHIYFVFIYIYIYILCERRNWYFEGAFNSVFNQLLMQSLLWGELAPFQNAEPHPPRWGPAARRCGVANTSDDHTSCAPLFQKYRNYKNYKTFKFYKIWIMEIVQNTKKYQLFFFFLFVRYCSMWFSNISKINVFFNIFWHWGYFVL